MMQNEARGGRGVRRLPRAFLVAVTLGSVALLAGACSGGSGSGGASGSPGASPGNPAAAATTGSLAYSQCMRAHGITNFPDPSSSGGISITGNSGINVNSSQYLAASRACQSLLGGQQSQAQLDQNYTAGLKYAHCMQSRGVDIPDPVAPGSAGGPVSQSNSSPGSGPAGSNGGNPNSPQYIAANKACEHYLPTGQGPSLGGNGGGS